MRVLLNVTVGCPEGNVSCYLPLSSFATLTSFDNEKSPVTKFYYQTTYLFSILSGERGCLQKKEEDLVQAAQSELLQERSIFYRQW